MLKFHMPFERCHTIFLVKFEVKRINIDGVIRIFRSWTFENSLSQSRDEAFLSFLQFWSKLTFDTVLMKLVKMTLKSSHVKFQVKRTKTREIKHFFDETSLLCFFVDHSCKIAITWKITFYEKFYYNNQLYVTNKNCSSR